MDRRGLMDRLTKLRGFVQPTRADWIFAIRTTAAGLIAISVAYALQLEQPQWAMMTVFIVSQPVAGMVLAKGFFRLLGTLVGALAAVALTVTVSASPWLFVAILAIWIGLCTYAASLLRNPEAYGAALAGYTAAIIAMPAFGHQHLAVELAVARCSEIMLGIVCAGIASRLILPQLARDAIIQRLSRSIIDLATYARAAFTGGDNDKLDALHRKLIAETQALAEMRAYARLEAPSLATHGHPVRRTIGHFLSALSTTRMLHGHAAPQNVALMPVRNELKSVVADLSATGVAALDDTAPWVARLDAIATQARRVPDKAAEGDDRVGTVARLTLAAEFADALKEALRGLDAVREPTATRHEKREKRQPALVVHRDREAALRNAVRAALATTLVIAFWMATRWADVAGIAIIVAVVSSLFASRPAPLETSWEFFKGTLLAVPFSFMVGQIALPALPGFGWFMLFVIPVLVVGALGMANRQLVGIATAFAINFLAFLNPHQTMVYAPQVFFNGTASILVGILLAMGVFAVVLPARPHIFAARLVRALHEDLARLCLHERIPRRLAFESLTYDRINQLLPYAQRLGDTGKALLGGSVAAVTVGLEILRLRKLQFGGKLAERDKAFIAAFLSRFANEALLPPTGKKSLQAMADSTRQAASEMAARRSDAETLQAAAALRVIAAALEDYPIFFGRLRS
ncbi:putative membrane protein YccC [Pseudaminobacter salicylatoxidans]|uniref:Putative membrane protein YccC n=1 Tax=Pseudaminobacter salicylatoxidans TaxID=93369 RepID=A0A316CU34_PSESE|nr:FUSC family protein [Pseudaminobacter salicylatoxidans]PWJ85644.1 putative membrane protein YccC [Pseudaminobacter salicylatoxidans]